MNYEFEKYVEEYECEYKNWYETKFKSKKKPIHKEEVDNELIDYFESEVD